MFLCRKEILLVLALSITMFLIAGCGSESVSYNLNMELEGQGSVTPSEGIHSYEEDTVVDIEADPEEGWEFSHWEGEVAESESLETTVLMDGDKTVKAIFEEEELVVEFSLTMEVEGQGTVTPEVGTHSFEEDTIVEIEAEPAEGWEFSHWEGEVAESESPETTVLMDGDKTVKAIFEEENDFFRYSEDYSGWVDGARLEYKSKFEGNVGWIEWDITFMETKHGVDVFELEQEQTNGESYTAYFYFVRKGLEYYMFYDEDDIFNGDGFNKENGLLWIEKPISKGDLGFALDPEYPLLLEAKEIEYIETEAGVFKAWRFYGEEEDPFDMEVIEINFWFVPYLGVVKYTFSSFGDFGSLELIDFKFNQ